jgi:hypothetical protein
LVAAKRVELKRSAEATGFHEAYFRGPITFGARRNALALHATDLDRPFLTYNAELLDMLNLQLEERRAQSPISEQVKFSNACLRAGRSWMSRKWHFCSATRIRILSIELSERGRGRHPPS